MTETMTIEPLALDAWADKARSLATNGYRLVQMCATDRPEHFEVLVTFDKAYVWLNYTLEIPKANPVAPSITTDFAAAFPYENEMHDLFGITFEGLNPDFGGRFIQTEKKLPFATPAPEPKEPKEKAVKQDPADQAPGAPEVPQGPACTKPTDLPGMERVPGDAPRATADKPADDAEKKET